MIPAAAEAPPQRRASTGDVRPVRSRSAPLAALVFYRSVLEGAQTAPDRCPDRCARERGIGALAIFVASLKDEASAEFIVAAFAEHRPT